MKTPAGINFLVDAHGRKTAVQIDLKRHAGLWEDIYDNLVASKREREPLISFEQVKRELAARRARDEAKR